MTGVSNVTAAPGDAAGGHYDIIGMSTLGHTEKSTQETTSEKGNSVSIIQPVHVILLVTMHPVL